MNKAWHDKNAMPKRATVAQRIGWHVEHQRRCGCRPIPARVREQMEAALKPKAPPNMPQFVEIGVLPEGFDAIGAFLPKDATRVRVYLLPISMRWGPDKLGALINETLNEPVDRETAYVFTNAKRDALLVFWLENNSMQTMQQHLNKGGFVLPGYADGLPWAEIAPKHLRRLFRTSAH